METALEQIYLRMGRIEALLVKLVNKHDLGKEEHGNDKLFTMEEAAAFLHLSKSSVYKLIYNNGLKPIQKRKRNKILFAKDELTAYLKQNNTIN